MARPKRHNPYDPNKVHDRRATELPRGALVAVIDVDDPYEIGAKISTVRNLRNDPLAGLHARRHIDEAQFQGGRAFQDDFETIERGAKAIDPSQPYVDCSRGPERVSDAYSKAFVRLNRAVKELGADGCGYVHAVLVHGLSYRKIAQDRGLLGERWEKYIGIRFQECLNCLARVYGFAMK